MFGQQMLLDIESRGKLSFYKGIHKTYAEAEAYARKTYHAVLWQDTFIMGWNMAKWSKK